MPRLNIDTFLLNTDRPFKKTRREWLFKMTLHSTPVWISCDIYQCCPAVTEHLYAFIMVSI